MAATCFDHDAGQTRPVQRSSESVALNGTRGADALLASGLDIRPHKQAGYMTARTHMPNHANIPCKGAVHTCTEGPPWTGVWF